MEKNVLDSLLTLFRDNPSLSTIIASLVSLLGGSSLFSFLRRPKKIGQGDAKYLADQKLLTPPMKRPAYSDRMAYVLAELSSLAYLKFEEPGRVIVEATKDVAKHSTWEESEIGKRLEKFANDLLIKGVDSEEFLRKHLKKAQFELLGTVNVSETQAFVCKRVAEKEQPYVVVAYRGTEKKVSDWLTDARAIPETFGNTKVHSGFLNALTMETDSAGKTALQRVEDILNGPKTKDDNNEPLPLFITGHSLGGALALLTTKLIASDINGACYTYGAPRVANYDYFKGMKTPVFRVVNSVDIVPRLPPGAVTTLIILLLKGLAWVTACIPAIPKILGKIESWLDKLSDFRHHGDQRYLTDIKCGQFDTVRLLNNPPAIDRLIWMGQQLRVSRFAPVKSHGMEIYRKKLEYLANTRNRNP